MMSTVALGPQLLNHTGWEWSVPGSPLLAPFLLHRYAVSQPKRNQLWILSSFLRLSKATSFCPLLSPIHLLGSCHFPRFPRRQGRFLLRMVPSSDLPGLDWESEVSSRDPRPWPHTRPPPPPYSPLPPWRGASSCHCWGGGQWGVLLLPSRLSPESFQAKGHSSPIKV